MTLRENRQKIHLETIDSWPTCPGSQPQGTEHEGNECSMGLHQQPSCSETQIQQGSGTNKEVLKICSYLTVILTDRLKKCLSVRPPL